MGKLLLWGLGGLFVYAVLRGLFGRGGEGDGMPKWMEEAMRAEPVKVARSEPADDEVDLGATVVPDDRADTAVGLGDGGGES